MDTVAGGGGRNGFSACKNAGESANKLNPSAMRTALAAQVRMKKMVYGSLSTGCSRRGVRSFIGVSFLFCEVYT